MRYTPSLRCFPTVIAPALETVPSHLSQDGHTMTTQPRAQDGHISPATQAQNGHNISPATQAQGGHNISPATQAQGGHNISPATQAHDATDTLQLPSHSSTRWTQCDAGACMILWLPMQLRKEEKKYGGRVALNEPNVIKS